MSIRFAAPVTVVLAMLAAGSADAAPITWNLTASPCASTGGTSMGNTRTYCGGGMSVTASAWANTADLPPLPGGANTALAVAQIEVFGGGLGVRNGDWNVAGSGKDTTEGSSPEHAIDNNERYDSILLDFSKVVRMTALNIGWIGSDSDITVMAYVGGGAPALAGASYGSLMGGWTNVGHYLNAGTGSETINLGGYASRYWMIGAYNPLVGGDSSHAGNDAIKLETVTAVEVVPEPASLGLFGLGLVALAARLRRGRRA